MNVLNTGIGIARNVDRYLFGEGALSRLREILLDRRKGSVDSVVFLVDEFFEGKDQIVGALPIDKRDCLIFVSTADEPTTLAIDNLVEQLHGYPGPDICAVVGMGGGTTLDTAKAISNLIANGGRAADYQGWDLVPGPGLFKVGIPTLSGTGAEATRTCVMTNKENGLKLGMNSDYTVFNQLILDPNLTATVPEQQYFLSGMDAWIHCIESLNGSYRNPIGDAFSHQAINLCREVFSGGKMMSPENRAAMMVASYLGGCAIATSYVGVVHPFSAGLSVVLGLHHCVANCIVMTAMESFYPDSYHEFMGFLEKNQIKLPRHICADLTEAEFDALYQATIIHEKPLTNALGEDFRDILTPDRVMKIFQKM